MIQSTDYRNDKGMAVNPTKFSPNTYPFIDDDAKKNYCFESNIKSYPVIYATYWQRLLAYNIDLLILIGLYYLYSLIPLSIFDSIAYVLIYLLYHIIFELTSWKGSPGKKWMGLCVIEEKHPRILSVAIRNAIKPISLALFFCGFVMIHFSKKKQSLHDYVSKTIVISKKSGRGKL